MTSLKMLQEGSRKCFFSKQFMLNSIEYIHLYSLYTNINTPYPPRGQGWVGDSTVVAVCVCYGRVQNNKGLSV